MRLTTAKYYTPAGRLIQADGINPDIVVENDLTRTKGEKYTPIKEKDLDRHLEGAKKPAAPQKIDEKKPDEGAGAAPDLTTAKTDEDDIQLVMARQILKSWHALRGK